MHNTYTIAKISLLARLSLFIFIFTGTVSLLFYSSNPYILFTSIGFFAFAIILIPPSVQIQYSVFSPWSLLGLSVFLGSTIRGIYIGIGYPDLETLNYFYFLDEDADYFIAASILMLLCLLFATLGYLYGPISRKEHSYLNFQNKTIDIKRLYFFSILTLIISLVTIFAYIQLTGGFNIINISGKRSTIASLNLGEDHRTWQSLKTIASISMLAHLFILIDAFRSNKNKLLKFTFAAILFFTAIFLPFYTSSRNEVFMYAIFSFATIYYVKQKIQWGKLILITVLAVSCFQVMSTLRSSDSTINETVSNIVFNTSILDSLVLNRNALEVAKTAHIINSIPDKLKYQYGKTIAIWLVAPIPRELWNSKPLISSGPIIGTNIYGTRVSGVPPGFVGEMYWNFSILGIIIGGFLLGWFLKFFSIRFSPSLLTIPVYVFGPMQAGYIIIGTSTGSGVFNIGLKTLIALLILKIITKKQYNYGTPINTKT